METNVAKLEKSLDLTSIWKCDIECAWLTNEPKLLRVKCDVTFLFHVIAPLKILTNDSFSENMWQFFFVAMTTVVYVEHYCSIYPLEVNCTSIKSKNPMFIRHITIMAIPHQIKDFIFGYATSNLLVQINLILDVCNNNKNQNKLLQIFRSKRIMWTFSFSIFYILIWKCSVLILAEWTAQCSYY